MHAPSTTVSAAALATLLALGGCATPPAPGSLMVEESTTLRATPEEVWRAVGRFDNVSWHPVVARTELVSGSATQAGAVRQITTTDGAQLRESLLSMDVATFRYSYRIDASPLPVQRYVSTLRVEPQGSGSRVVWGSRFDRDPAAAGVSDAQAREIVSGIYRAGLTALQKRYGG